MMVRVPSFSVVQAVTFKSGGKLDYKLAHMATLHADALLT